MPARTVKLHRILRSPADRVYRAFITAGACEQWLPPQGFLAKVHEMDSRIGGSLRISYIEFANGYVHSFTGAYLELEPCRRIVYTIGFDNPHLAGPMRITVTLREVFCGVELRVTQENNPPSFPLEAAYLGWQDALDALARLVEAEKLE